MKRPENWKDLERHPLSKEYADITGPAWEHFVRNLMARGIVGYRKVVLHHGKVIDGWQLQRACVQAANAGSRIKPLYQELKLPPGMTIEQYVETVNDHRRHETQEQATKRIEKRRGRVANAREEGKSIRTIAEEEGVSPGTVQRDLETVTVSGDTVQPPDGMVTGKDGRKQPAARRRTQAECVGQVEPKPPVIREREPGDHTEADKAAPPNPPPEPPAGGSAEQVQVVEQQESLLDALDEPVPPGLAPVFSQVPRFREIVNQLNAINQELAELAQSPAGACLRLQGAQIDLKNLKNAVHFDTPYAVCPVCQGDTKQSKANCPCKQRGWLLEGAYRNLPSEYRE
jgi:hypothetical protein